ncbi:hypothetical protein [Chamaesiphon sp. VAR_48_metabat_403]|uniref:hypothetical protein n=1 Tax=Chamaesiphon sp. VAR_48_metabat_403 TaxID=2964700 RepID=UPI00286DBB58|nr:hypothetical protein [Chamaesiphon sp. VAR_48_metabat_403]
MSDNHSDRSHQARILFSSAMFAAAFSASVTLLGAGEICTGNPQGTEIMMGGLTASIQSLRLAQAARDRVNKISN